MTTKTTSSTNRKRKKEKQTETGAPKTRRRRKQRSTTAKNTSNLNVISNIIFLIVSLNLLTQTNPNNATDLANSTVELRQQQPQQVSTTTTTTLASLIEDKTSTEKRSLIATAAGRQRRPDSSSSVFAEVEDLKDSSIRTRLGVVAGRPEQTNEANASNIEHLGDSPHDFDKLVDRMLSQAGQNNHLLNQQADPFNNRTSMRFFRNNKTFASVVYTNGEPRQPKRLINCHLVDLEKHSSDVALYESKYDIRTVDVEFRDMMQLIEACTNIARLRWRPTPANLPAGHHNQSAPNAAQLFAASLPAGSDHTHHQSGVRPLVVVGRPFPSSEQPAPGANSVASFQSVMWGALNSELRRLPSGATRDDSNKLDLPQQRARSFVRRSHLHRHKAHRSRRSRPVASSTARSVGPAAFLSTGPPPPAEVPRKAAHKLLTKAIEKVGETTKNIQKKLVLGEVTAPPTASDDGSFREALEEITNYDTTDLLAIWRGILPGTNWCGMGDRATSYNDLGFESDIDICCRAHDFCPVRLAAFSSGYGLFNWSFYTRSHCWCDQNFLDCLQRAESPLSSVVMKFYFTIMKTTCLNDNETSALASQLKSHRSFFTVHTSSSSSANGSRPTSSPWSPALNRMQMMFGGRSRDNGDQSSANSRLQQHQQQQQPPIPALKQSQPLQTKLEDRRGQQTSGRALRP